MTQRQGVLFVESLSYTGSTKAMNGRRRFVVIIPRRDGGVESYPMKEWLRQHPDHIPPGLDATANNAWSLRDGLRKQGWTVTETPTEVRLVPPWLGASESTIHEVLGGGDEDEDEAKSSEEPEAAFALEYQLRDFIGQNLGAIRINGMALQLYVDPTGRDGIEFPSATGPIGHLSFSN
jgi:endonuclease